MKHTVVFAIGSLDHDDEVISKFLGMRVETEKVEIVIPGLISTGDDFNKVEEEVMEAVKKLLNAARANT